MHACVCSVLAEASLHLCAVGVPHRAVIGSASDPEALLGALCCAGIDDLEVPLTHSFTGVLCQSTYGPCRLNSLIIDWGLCWMIVNLGW